MTVNEKIKIINNKIEQNKAQFNSDKKLSKVSALSSGNVGKSGFYQEKIFYPKKDC